MFSVFLETESELKNNLAISGVTASASAKSESRNRIVFAEARRAEIANRASEICSIEQIADLHA